MPLAIATDSTGQRAPARAVEFIERQENAEQHTTHLGSWLVSRALGAILGVPLAFPSDPPTFLFPGEGSPAPLPMIQAGPTSPDKVSTRSANASQTPLFRGVLKNRLCRTKLYSVSDAFLTQCKYFGGL